MRHNVIRFPQKLHRNVTVTNLSSQSVQQKMWQLQSYIFTIKCPQKYDHHKSTRLSPGALSKCEYYKVIHLSTSVSMKMWRHKATHLSQMSTMEMWLLQNAPLKMWLSQSHTFITKCLVKMSHIYVTKCLCKKWLKVTRLSQSVLFEYNPSTKWQMMQW